MAPKRRSEPFDSGWQPSGQPFVPGLSPRPHGDDDVHRIAEAAHNPTNPSSWRSNPAWRAGVTLYAQGFFWEAHEVWEAVWMNARPNSRERALVQALIQLANAALKQRMGRPEASRRLAALAASRLTDAGTQGFLMGVDLAALHAGSLAYHRALARGDRASPPQICTQETKPTR